MGWEIKTLKCIFIKKKQSSPVHLYVFTGQSWPPQYGGDTYVSQRQAEAANAVSAYIHLWLIST